jgi:prolyl oligopeptidase PreP (S9A serine peptidase family)
MMLCQRHQISMPAGIGVPIGSNGGLIVVAVVTPTPRIEHDIGVTAVHDAVLAYLFIQHIQSQSDNKWMDLQRSRRELTLAKNISQAI